MSGCLSQYIQFPQIIAFGFSHFLWCRFVFPVPVIQVAGMKQQFAFRFYQERNAYISRTECPDTDIFIFKNVPFLKVNSIFGCRPAAFQNIFGENIFDIRLNLFPFQDVRVEMIRMEMGG